MLVWGHPTPLLRVRGEEQSRHIANHRVSVFWFVAEGAKASPILMVKQFMRQLWLYGEFCVCMVVF